MKILLAHNNYNISGGADVFYREVGKSLEKKNNEVAYFSANERMNEANKYSAYFPDYANYQTGNIFFRVISFPKMVYSFEAKRKIEKLISDFSPDIVHTFSVHVKLTPSILDVCRSKGIPVIMSCNDYKIICPNYKLYHHGRICEDCKGGLFYKAALNACANNSSTYSIASSLEAYVHNTLNIYQKNIHTFLFASEFMAHKVAEFWGNSSFRWKLYRNPFDVSKCFYSDGSDDYILYFGRLIEEKGVDYLIQAMAAAPHVFLKIIGDGPDVNKLKSLVSRLGLHNIEFIGAKWGDELKDYLSRARFVVVPSIWYENYPYVILQAFASAKPVIGTDRGGIPEMIIHGQYGLVYPALDIRALTKSICELWSNPARCKEMGQNARRFVESEFNTEKAYVNLIDIYRSVLQ